MTMASSEPETAQKLQVLVAGLPRTGKSTGLNNIFGLDLPAGISARPVTDNVVSKTITRYGVSVTVTDTPGLKAADADKDEKVKQEIDELKLRPGFLLVVTMSVYINSCITQDFCNILKNLTSLFGKDVWNWSIVLLTFSDDTRNQKEFSTDLGKQEYVDLLKDHCTEFQKVLAGIGVNKRVSLFSEYSEFNQFKTEKLDGILAIPVGKNSEITTKLLLPLQPWTHRYQWTDLAFTEITKVGENVVNQKTVRSLLIQFRCGRSILQVLQQNQEEIIKAGIHGAICGAVASSDYSRGLGRVGYAVEVVTGGIVGGLAAGATVAGFYYIEDLLEQRNYKRSK